MIEDRVLRERVHEVLDAGEDPLEDEWVQGRLADRPEEIAGILALVDMVAGLGRCGPGVPIRARRRWPRFAAAAAAVLFCAAGVLALRGWRERDAQVVVSGPIVPNTIALGSAPDQAEVLRLEVRGDGVAKRGMLVRERVLRRRYLGGPASLGEGRVRQVGDVAARVVSERRESLRLELDRRGRARSEFE